MQFRYTIIHDHINPFVPSAPFLYPLKPSEKRVCIGNEWVKFISKYNMYTWTWSRKKDELVQVLVVLNHNMKKDFQYQYH